MKPHFLSVLAFLLVIVSAASHAQSVTNPETVLFALPSELRASASLYVPSEDGSLREIRAGSGPLFCIADQPGDERFSVSCHPKSTYDYVERARTLYAMQDNESERETLERELKNGYYEYPRGTMSYYASGPIDAGRSEPATLRH